MTQILRDPIWQGISGIVALIALILYILVEKGKFPKLGKSFSSTKSFLTIIFLLALCLFLLGVSWLVIVAVTKEFGSIVGGAVSEIIYGIITVAAFIAIAIIFPGDHKNPILFIKTISLLVLAELLIRVIFLVISKGGNPEGEIYAYWRGMFLGGMVMLIAINWSSKNKE